MVFHQLLKIVLLGSIAHYDNCTATSGDRFGKQMSKPRKEKILDVAEKLLAQRGFYGVSLRDIASEAEVDVALINYHFGKKRELLSAGV